MAKKKERNIVQAPEAGGGQVGLAGAGSDDLQVLHPNQVVVIGGQSITVREYGFVEGLQLRPKIQPLLDDLYVLIKGGPIDMEDVIVLLGNHHVLTTELVAIAADVDQAFLAGLGQRDGYKLLMAWWAANGPFYLAALMERREFDRAVAAARKDVGATSIPSSSPGDTELPTPSAE
jgi:hypothetical protein